MAAAGGGGGMMNLWDSLTEEGRTAVLFLILVLEAWLL